MLEVLTDFKHYGDDDYIDDIQIEIVTDTARVNII